jgi:hypothetical protein
MHPILLYALCAAAAPIVSVASVLFLLGCGLDSYWPAFSDDVVFNHQIRTFATAGFSGGYYTVGEMPAPLSFTHFGPHGPFYPALYGVLLWPFGANVSGPIWAHHGVMWMATFLGLLLVRPTAGGALAVGAVVTTFWPALSMLTASMQEGLHFSIAIFGAAAAFYGRGRIGAAVYGVASVIRPTWALGMIALIQKPLSGHRLALRLGGVALLSVGFIVLFGFISAPVSRGIISQTRDVFSGGEMEGQVASLIFYFHQKILANLAFVASPARWQPLEGQVLVLSAVVAVLALARADWRIRMSALALVITFTLIVTFYDLGGYRGFRILGPVTLMALVTCALSVGSKRIVISLIVLNLLFTGSFMQFLYENRSPVFGDQNSKFARIADDLSARMKFDIDVDAWCNTVLVDHADFGPSAAVIPAGFGLSVVTGLAQMPASPKSAFVMVSPENAQRVGFPSEITYRSDEFIILRNLRRDCGRGKL